MTVIAKWAHADVVLSPGQVLRVSTASSATVKSEFGATVGATTVSASTQDFGPFAVPTKLSVAAVGGRAQISTVAPDLRALVVSSAAPVDNDGRPDGTIYIQTL